MKLASATSKTSHAGSALVLELTTHIHGCVYFNAMRCTYDYPILRTVRNRRSGLTGRACILPVSFDQIETLAVGQRTFDSTALPVNASLPYPPRQCLIYRGAARRSPKDATLQPPPLQIVYPCGSPATSVEILLSRLAEFRERRITLVTE